MSIEKKCRNCGELNPLEYPACVKCGTVFDKDEARVKFCPNCGAQNPSLRASCLSCGIWFAEAERSMGLSDVVRELPREARELAREARELLKRTPDKTRIDIWEGLRTLGIDAQLAEPGQPEDNVGVGRAESLGMIDIAEGPIRWVNVAQRVTPHQYGSTYYTHVHYGVPSTKLVPNSSKLLIRSVRKKTFPLFGRVGDVYWKGEDLGSGIIGRLNSDLQVKEAITRSRDVIITAHDYLCWRETDVGTERTCCIITPLPGVVTSERPDLSDVFPLVEHWSCYQAIAQHLLAAPLSER